MSQEIHIITKELFKIINTFGTSNGYNAKKGIVFISYKGYKYMVNYINNTVLKCWKIYQFEDKEIYFKLE
jgi:hypothetical protein